MMRWTIENDFYKENSDEKFLIFVRILANFSRTFHFADSLSSHFCFWFKTNKLWVDDEMIQMSLLIRFYEFYVWSKIFFHVSFLQVLSQWPSQLIYLQYKLF